MPQEFGHERLAQQVGEMVAAKVYEGSTSDYKSALFTEVGTTEIEKLFIYALDAYCKYDGDEDIIVCREPGVFAKEVGEERSTDVWVEQQVELGDWRADFVI